jgi:hypothetical protein
MHSERVPVKAANNVPKVLNTVVSPFSLCIRHRNRDREGKRRFGTHPIRGIPGPRPLEQFFHPVTLLLDGNNERHLYLGQKLEYLPGIEFPVKAEYLDREAEFSDPVETLGDVPTFEVP